jgi:hypothetical protein
VTRKLPGRGDWDGLLETARETALRCEPGDPVAHGKLVSTVADECRTDNGTAGRWIDTAVEKGFLDRRGTGIDREYIAIETDSSLYDGDAIERYTDPDSAAESEPSAEDIERALALTAEYYHEQLTPEIRWMIDGKWGIDSETIDDLGIGFAPSPNRLPEYLLEKGVSPTAALRAGVVRGNVVKHVYECEDPDECHHDMPDDLDELAHARAAGEVEASALWVARDSTESENGISLNAVVGRAQGAEVLELYAWWDSRIVFPYYEEDGTIRYFIARETGATDDLPSAGNKYLKLSNSKPWVDDEVVYEPIYGCGTVEEGEPLLLTEGITDAITAHEAGFRCVSPVTKAFKRDHHEELLAYAERAGDTYLCFDSEKSGAGLDGALRTAWMLQDNGVEVSIAELPRGGNEEKIDLADFLKENDASALREVLIDAITLEAHPAFDPATHGDEATTRRSDSGRSSGGSPKKSGSHRSAMYELSIEDVVENDSRYGLNSGYRGVNPFQHWGKSENYFEYKKFKGDMRARDFKSEYTYTPLTWLVCAAGARSAKSPSGSLSDEEHWEAWRYAKEEDILDDTDPIPWAASQHLARKHNLAPSSLLRAAADSPRTLPPTVHNRIFELVEDEYDLNPGRDTRDADYKDEQRADFLAGDGDSEDDEAADAGVGGEQGEHDEDKDAQIKRMLATLDAMNAEN